MARCRGAPHTTAGVWRSCLALAGLRKQGIGRCEVAHWACAPAAWGLPAADDALGFPQRCVFVAAPSGACTLRACQQAGELVGPCCAGCCTIKSETRTWPWPWSVCIRPGMPTQLLRRTAAAGRGAARAGTWQLWWCARA
jgi:hypothetical protein